MCHMRDCVVSLCRLLLLLSLLFLLCTQRSLVQREGVGGLFCSCLYEPCVCVYVPVVVSSDLSMLLYCQAERNTNKRC